MQQYQFTERFEYVKTIEFKNTQPLHIQKIRFFKEEELTGLFTKKEFRYSFDNIIWTNWNTLTQANLTNIEFRDRPDFYLEVVYTRTGLGAGNILRWYLYYDSTAPTPPVPSPDSSIDADTLKGEGPAYYLDRANHTGPYTGLNILDVPDGSNVGVYHSRVDSSFGTTFYFKRIIGTQGIIVTDSSSGLITFRLNPDIYSNIVLDSSLGAEFYWSNGYLEVSTACCDQLKIYIDGSLASRDASIDWLYNNRTIGSVTEASLGTDFYWSNGYLEVTGSQGIQGTIGSQGRIGTQGSLGVQGAQGIQGQIGIQGIIGAQGRIGTQGSLGVQGIQGTIGLQGIQGTQGIQGKLGIQGSRGIQGTRGIQGIIGSQGLIGSQGDQGIQGTRGIQGREGAQGLGVQGSQGTDGLQGIQGTRGIQGREGAQGLGVQGTQGVQGKLGIQGSRGIQGLVGAQGLGVQGTQGEDGLQGIQGTRGIQGREGAQGLGVQGTQGTQGIQGLSIQGAQGKIGPQGLCIQGTQGTFGIQGAQGISGGFAGQGVQGTEGSQGIQGTQGLQGAQGSNQDASLNELYAWQIIQDVSILTLTGGIYNSSLDPSITMPNTIGGIPAGTSVYDLDGDTLSSLWDALLFPTAYPTLTNPSSSFTINPTTTLYEIAQNISLSFTATFNRGSINPQYTAASPYRSGLPNTYNYTGTGLPSSVLSTSLTDNQSNPSYVVINGNQSWTSYISYDAGVQPKDSKGNNYSTPLSAGNTSIITRTIEGVYPLFGTTTNITTLTKQTLVSMITGNNIVYNMVPESGGNKQKFEIPNAWLTSRPLQGIQTYNTLTLSWEYQGGTQATSLSYWTTSSVTETVQGNIINYTRYTYNGTDRSSIQIRLIF